MLKQRKKKKRSRLQEWLRSKRESIQLHDLNENARLAEGGGGYRKRGEEEVFFSD